MAKDKKNGNGNNGIINSGSGVVNADGTVMGDPDDSNTTSGTNNGVINSGSGVVNVSGAVMGVGTSRH